MQQEKHQRAAERFHQFLAICQETDYKIAEGSAYSLLASAYEAMGDRAQSIKFLEAFH